MNLERMKQINELAELLWDEPESQWKAILRERCGGDDELANEVISFVRNCLESSPERPRPVVFIDVDAVTKEPDTIGPYTVVRRIGKGGMGVVYEALRPGEDIERRVAIKVIKPGFDSEEVVKRFRRERYILSQLGNLRIVQIFDSGSTPDGRPYLVMEYVDGGVPIDEYCDARNFGVAERLKLFQKVCAVVEYAHQRLVVHRDLKPSNILITPDGEPKLLDFGLAGLLETRESDPSFVHSVTTQVNTGTWEYMSPEQARGEPALTVSDIYSLGVVLFELLAGQRPYDFPSESPAVATKIICEQEAPRASSIALEGSAIRSAQEKLSDLQRRDLDEIVDGALAKLPEERYPTVSAFSETIQTYLDGKPIPRFRSDWRYRTKKFVRRNRRVVLTGALIFVCLLAGVEYLWKSAREQARARDRKDFLARNLRETIQSFDQMLPGKVLSEFAEAITGEKWDIDTVESTLQRRADNGDAAAQLILGLGYVSIVESMKNLPNTDDPGMRRLNEQMRDTVSRRVTSGQALEYLQKAAETNSVAAALLAEVYSEGVGGIPKDPWGAFKWAKRSAEAGNAMGGSALGRLYWHGVGTEKNRAEGFRWLKASAEAGDIVGQTFLCSCYTTGAMVQRDVVRAHMWCNLAASNKQWGSLKMVEEARAQAQKIRDALEKTMSAAQVRRAEKLAADMSQKLQSRQ